MYTTSSTLIDRIRNPADDESWRVFYARYVPLVYSVARGQGLGDQDAEDVVQSVMLGVARGIQRYDRSRGQFRRWLLGATFNKIRDALGRRHLPLIGDLPELPPEPAQDHPFVINWEREWRKRLLLEAIDRVRAEGDDRAFQSFWLRVVDGWTVADVAKALNLKPERIYDYKHRISKRIAKTYRGLTEEARED